MFSMVMKRKTIALYITMEAWRKDKKNVHTKNFLWFTLHVSMVMKRKTIALYITMEAWRKDKKIVHPKNFLWFTLHVLHGNEKKTHSPLYHHGGMEKR